MNLGFNSSNARMDQLELAVVSSTATITQNTAAALAQSTAISGKTGAVDISNRNHNTAIYSSLRRRAKRPSDRVACIRLPFLLQRSWELAVYRASGGWHVSLTASRIVPDDSPFLAACGDGDIVKVRAMLASGEGTVLDVDEDGRNCLHTALSYCAIGSDRDIYFAVCQLLLKAGVDVNTKSIYNATNFEMSGRLESRFLRLLVSHEDTDPDSFELEGVRDIRWLNPETVGVWQDQMWPPWRERSLEERIKCILATEPDFGGADQLKLWIDEPPEDIWAECGELSDGLLAYMLRMVVMTVSLNTFWICVYQTELLEKDLLETDLLETYHLKTQLASWSELIRYGLKDKTIGSAFWMIYLGTPAQEFFTECFSGFSTRKVEGTLFCIARFLYTLGIDLVALGRVEKDRQRLEGSLTIRLGYTWQKDSTYMVGFDYGPKPEDWKIWWSNPRDECVGEFWEMVEGDEMDQAEKDMPGAWPDSEDDSSDSD